MNGDSGEWELYDLSNDGEEKRDIGAEHPDILNQLINHARDAHGPIRPGKVYHRDVIEKDRRQAPHKRTPKPLKQGK